MPRPAHRRGADARPSSTRSVPWSCAWPGRMPLGEYRRIHGELAALGIKVAASTVWEILREHGIPPTPERASTTWADFLRSQADALLACDFFETRALTGARLYVFALIEHATRRIRILGGRRTSHRGLGGAARAQPRHGLGGRGQQGQVPHTGPRLQVHRCLRRRAGRCGAAGRHQRYQMPRMNSITERWIQTCRRELLDRMLVWNHSHLLHALREFESFYNGHRPHQALQQAAPLRPLPEQITQPGRSLSLEIRRRDRAGGTLHEYQHAA